MTWRRQQQRPRRGRQEKATATVKTIECCRSIDVGNRNCANAKPLLLRGPQRHSVGTTHDDDGTDQCQCQGWGDLDRYSAGTSRTIYKKALVTQKKNCLNQTVSLWRHKWKFVFICEQSTCRPGQTENSQPTASDKIAALL